MALIDIRCPADHLSEVSRPAADWPATPPCPYVLADGTTCGAPTTQIHQPSRTPYAVDPVVVYQAPDGSFRFPGDVTPHSTAKYDRAGYTRIELRTAVDVRRFESHMNKREYARTARRVERKQQMREERESVTRSELRRLMPRMSAFGRQLAREAQRRNDAKPRERVIDAGFHIDVYSNDRSNRDDSRDAQGRRRRD